MIFTELSIPVLDKSAWDARKTNLLKERFQSDQIFYEKQKQAIDTHTDNLKSK